MRLGIVLHPNRQAATDVAALVAHEAATRGMAVFASKADAARIPGVDPWPGDDADAAEVLVAVGGDGTVLEAARLSRSSGAPVIGVNAGHVGFLAEVEPDRISQALDAIVAGDYRLSTRMTLEALLPDGNPVEALNDVVVEKAISRQVVRIGVSVAGERLVEYRTDAVIVASPTGSTAYTFSAGGPLVDPEIEALVLTAVAPHNLFGRPIVFGPETELTLEVAGERPARVNMDGHTVAEMKTGDTIEVRRGKRAVRLMRLNPQGFAHTVKEKFHLHDA